ncbi:hypothetical protein [Kutzneria sp. 744]|nr:hypothetical protein [Kutzneria sp. 744]
MSREANAARNGGVFHHVSGSTGGAVSCLRLAVHGVHISPE